MQLLGELVKIFAAEYPELLLKIDAATRDGDAEALREASHKLKGSLLQLSAPVAAQAASNLERLAASNSLNNVVLSVNMLKTEIDFLARVLEAMVSSGPERANKAGEN